MLMHSVLKNWDHFLVSVTMASLGMEQPVRVCNRLFVIIIFYFNNKTIRSLFGSLKHHAR